MKPLRACSLLLLFLGFRVFAAGISVTLMEAVETTLKNQPYIKLQRENVKIYRAILRQRKGEFDPYIEAYIKRERTNIPLSESLSRRQDSTELQLSLKKKFRSGIVLGPSLTLTQTDTKWISQKAANTASLNFSIVFPLMKGRGKLATSYEEMASKTDLDASYKDLKHTVSESVLNTILSYWDYLGAKKTLDIRLEAERRAKRLVEDVKKLVEAGERPPADLDQLYANLEAKKSQRIMAEDDFFQAKHRLGIAMGVPYSKIEEIELPATDFPLPPSHIPSLERLLDLAMKNRADLEALSAKLESAKLRFLGASKNTKPNLDLSLSLGYTSFKRSSAIDDMFWSLNKNIPGPNISLTLAYRYPIGNNIPEGKVEQNRALYNQTLINIYDLKRTIKSDVSRALNSLVEGIKRYRKAQDAMRQYAKAVLNEKKKLQLGMSTVIDVVTMEDYFRDAELMVISAQRDFSKAIATLRYATGTLVIEKEKGEYEIDIDSLTTPP